MTNWSRLDDRPLMVGVHALAGLLEGWSTGSPGRLSRRLAHRLRSVIRSGLLEPGTRLPPERSLAPALAVSRATVVAALDELRADGLVVSRHGSGTVVAAAAAGLADPEGLTFAEAALADHRAINLAVSAPADASALGDLVLTAADLVSVDPAHGYAPDGLPSLRAAVAARHTSAGLATAPDAIHVTNGAQHALALILGAHCRPGDTVAVEDPTYVGLNDVARALGLRLVPLPGDLADGPDPEQLVRLCRSRRARAAVLLPAVHSPTGRRLGSAARAALAGAVDACPGMLVIEDNTLADLGFRAGRPPSLARLCETARVVSVETLSKVAWGGLRIGWLRARPDLLAPVTARRGATDIGSPIPSQVLAATVLDRLDELIAQRRTVLARRAGTLTRLLRAAVPDWTFAAPAGGLSLWVDIGPAVAAGRFAEAALAHGVAVAPGSSACVARSGDHHLRLCFDRPEAELAEAAARLAAAWDRQRSVRRGELFSSS